MSGVSPEVQLALIEDDIATYPPQVQNRYFCMVDNGISPKFAQMAATRSAPQMKGSDRAFNQESRRKMNEMSEGNRDDIVAQARKAGVDTEGKYYMSGLGRYDDPMAWCSTSDDVKHVCKSKNLTARGVVEHKGTQVDPPKAVPLAEDLVNECIGKVLKNEPKTAEKFKRGKVKKAELRERVIAQHGTRKK